LAELKQPGVKFSEVARRYDISRGLLWQWRDAQRRGRLVAETPVFLPLQVVPELTAPEPSGGSGLPPCTGCSDPDDGPDERIEIVLPDGTAVRVTVTISTAALRRVLAALRA
jgi:transposase